MRINYLLSLKIALVALLFIISCNDQNDIEPSLNEQSFLDDSNQNSERFATALNDPLLSNGLGFVVEKSQEFKASTRSTREFDFSQLENQEAIKSFDSTTFNTTYVYFINQTDSSLTNFVISEKEGIYVAFFMEYLPNDTIALNDMSLFEGQIKLSSVNGDFSDLIVTESELAENGRSSVCVTRTICTQVSVPGLGLYGSIRDCYTTVSCTSFSGHYVAGGLDTGTEDNRDPLAGYGTLTSNSMPERVPVNRNSNFTFDIDNDDKDQNSCEWALARKYPSQAFKIHSNVSKASSKTHELFGINGRNDCSDAFRHAYFQILNTRSVGANITRQFGEAHECDSDNEKETEMDLHNNDVGISIAQFNPHVPEETLIQFLLDKLHNGDLKILSNLNSLNKVTNRTQVISSESCAD